MNPAAIGGRPLQYFIHDDFDALRMEIAGSLVGKAAQKAYDAWRTARLISQRMRVVVDITFVTETDEAGQEVLRRWHDQDARIIASSTASRAIAEAIPGKPVPASPRLPLRNRLASWFIRQTARNSAFAGRSPSHLTARIEKTLKILHLL